MRRWAILWKSDLGLLIYGSTREGIEEGVGCSGGKIKVLTGAHEQRLQLRSQCRGRKGSDWLAGCSAETRPKRRPPLRVNGKCRICLCFLQREGAQRLRRQSIR